MDGNSLAINSLRGINWFVSAEVASTQRGIESPDLEKVDDKCPEKVFELVLQLSNVVR